MHYIIVYNYLNHLKLATLSQCLNLITKPEESDGLANNFGLNTLGKSLLSYYVTEHLLIHYPRLPMKIHQAAVDSLMGNLALLEIGKTWGLKLMKLVNWIDFRSRIRIYEIWSIKISL